MKALRAVLLASAALATVPGPAFAVYAGQEVWVSGPNPAGLLASCLIGGGVAGAVSILSRQRPGAGEKANGPGWSPAPAWVLAACAGVFLVWAPASGQWEDIWLYLILLLCPAAGFCLAVRRGLAPERRKAVFPAILLSCLLLDSLFFAALFREGDVPDLILTSGMGRLAPFLLPAAVAAAGLALWLPVSVLLCGKAFSKAGAERPFVLAAAGSAAAAAALALLVAGIVLLAG